MATIYQWLNRIRWAFRPKLKPGYQRKAEDWEILIP